MRLIGFSAWTLSTSPGRVAVSNRICAEEGCHSSLLHLLQETERSNDLQLISDIMHGYIYQPLSDTTIFSTIEAYSSYCQVQIAEKDRDMTAFSSPYNQFRFKRMVLRLKRQRDVSLRTMDVLLSNVKGTFALFI